MAHLVQVYYTYGGCIFLFGEYIQLSSSIFSISIHVESKLSFC